MTVSMVYQVPSVWFTDGIKKDLEVVIRVPVTIKSKSTGVPAKIKPLEIVMKQHFHISVCRNACYRNYSMHFSLINY